MRVRHTPVAPHSRAARAGLALAELVSFCAFRLGRFVFFLFFRLGTSGLDDRLRDGSQLVFRCLFLLQRFLQKPSRFVLTQLYCERDSCLVTRDLVVLDARAGADDAQVVG